MPTLPSGCRYYKGRHPLVPSVSNSLDASICTCVGTQSSAAMTLQAGRFRWFPTSLTIPNQRFPPMPNWLANGCLCLCQTETGAGWRRLPPPDGGRSHQGRHELGRLPSCNATARKQRFKLHRSELTGGLDFTGF